MQSAGIKTIGFSALGIAVIATSFLVFHVIGGVHHFSTANFLLLFVIVNSPYFIMAILLKMKSGERKKEILNCIAVIIVSFLGLYGMIDIIYVHPDAQGGIALAILPILQFLLFGVLTFVFFLITDLRTK